MIKKWISNIVEDAVREAFKSQWEVQEELRRLNDNRESNARRINKPYNSTSEEYKAAKTEERRNKLESQASAIKRVLPSPGDSVRLDSRQVRVMSVNEPWVREPCGLFETLKLMPASVTVCWFSAGDKLEREEIEIRKPEDLGVLGIEPHHTFQGRKRSRKRVIKLNVIARFGVEHGVDISVMVNRGFIDGISLQFQDQAQTIEPKKREQFVREKVVDMVNELLYTHELPYADYPDLVTSLATVSLIISQCRAEVDAQV